jgi:hypothetical protein
MAARKAKTKVHPFHSELETFLAAFWRARLHRANEIEMSALGHRQFGSDLFDGRRQTT